MTQTTLATAEDQQPTTPHIPLFALVTADKTKVDTLQSDRSIPRRSMSLRLFSNKLVSSQAKKLATRALSSAAAAPTPTVFDKLINLTIVDPSGARRKIPAMVGTYYQIYSITQTSSQRMVSSFTLLLALRLQELLCTKLAKPTKLSWDQLLCAALVKLYIARGGQNPSLAMDQPRDTTTLF